MNYLIFDLEGTYGTSHGRACSPFSNDHRICSVGFKEKGQEYTDRYFVKDGVGKTGTQVDFYPLNGIDLLVGHNIKFDLLWFWENQEIQDFLFSGGKIWDTMYAEYLLSAQFYNFNGGDQRGLSLKQVAKRRECNYQKLGIVAALWDKDIRTEDIEPDILLEYMKYDVLTTEEIFVQQYKEAQDKSMLSCIEQRHEGMLATAEMEYRGLVIDIKTARKQQVELEKQIVLDTEELNKTLPEFPKDLDFKWGSWKNVSALLFGGDIKYKTKKPVLEDGKLLYYKIKVRQPILNENKEQAIYKGGKNAGKGKTKLVQIDDLNRGCKLKWVDQVYTLPRQVQPDNSKKAKQEGYWQTGEDILLDIQKKQKFPLINQLLQLKGNLKDLGTYYEKTAKTGKKSGMLTMIQDDGKIHGHFNHSVTATTRLSSTKPNLQNISGKGKSQVKRIFTSRFGDDGVICEVDYSQLEVVCKAVLAKDDVYLKAIQEGIDEHCEWLSFAEGKPYSEVKELCNTDPVWKEKRQSMKACTFG